MSGTARIYRALVCSATFAMAGWLFGCATVAHGPKQTFAVDSGPSGAEIWVNGRLEGVTPDTLTFSRRNNHTLAVIDSLGRSTDIRLQRDWDPWVLGNAVALYWGLIGLGIDVGTGSHQILYPKWVEPNPRVRVTVTSVRNPMPWEGRGLYGGLGAEFLAKNYFNEEIARYSEPEIALSAWVGRKGWPLELVVKTYTESSYSMVNSWEMLAFGGQYAYRKPGWSVFPLVQGGLSLLENSTQGDSGIPLGVWGNLGLEIKLGRISIGLLGGGSKGETSTVKVNTGGIRTGMMLGVYL